MSACWASSRVSSWGRRSDRSMSSSCITSITSRWTRSAGVVPAEAAVCRPSAARSNSASLICERPALCRQTNRTCAIALLLRFDVAGLLAQTVAHLLVRERELHSRPSISIDKHHFNRYKWIDGCRSGAHPEGRAPSGELWAYHYVLPDALEEFSAWLG